MINSSGVVLGPGVGPNCAKLILSSCGMIDALAFPMPVAQVEEGMAFLWFQVPACTQVGRAVGIFRLDVTGFSVLPL